MFWIDMNNWCVFEWVINLFIDFGYICIVFLNGLEIMDFVKC